MSAGRERDSRWPANSRRRSGRPPRTPPLRRAARLACHRPRAPSYRHPLGSPGQSAAAMPDVSSSGLSFARSEEGIVKQDYRTIARFFSARRHTMKRLLFAVGLGLVVLSPAVRADDAPPPACGLTSAPFLAASDGNVLIGCSGGVSEAAGNQLAEILTRILQKRLDPQLVLVKLEE